MENETLFTSTKWEVLESLSKTAKTPLEIARTLNTSIANVSQQLRLLELAGLVNKKRLPRSQGNERRIVYSLALPIAYSVVASNRNARKEFIELNPEREALLSAWMIQDKVYARLVEDFLLMHFYTIKDFDYVAFESSSTTLYYDTKETIKEKSLGKDASVSITLKKSSITELDLESDSLHFLFAKRQDNSSASSHSTSTGVTKNRRNSGGGN